MTIMILEDETTWSSRLINYLDNYHDLFRNWETSNYSRVSVQEYDRAILGLRDVLRTSDAVLHGYHCTRLTDDEIRNIRVNGMQLPSQTMLHQRIESLEVAGLITPQISGRLKNENQASDSNRAKMLWFCFFPPYYEGQDGIERLFRSWGGEALYNSHERDPVTGPILRQIGTPCIVEAFIPILSLAEHGGLDFKVVSRYLFNRGLRTREPLHHEDRALSPIPAQNISRIIQFPESAFVTLTKCDTWDPSLS